MTIINTIPSIRWDVLQAPTLATPAERYQGHLPGSGVQRHSADPLYCQHGVHLRCIESGDGTRCMWEACKNGKVISANPSHAACELLAWAAVTGA